MAEREGFLMRWARRKAAAEQERPKEAAASDAPESPAAGPAAVPALQAPPGDATRCEPEVEKIDLSQLPDIESLTYESDFSVFMQPGVPRELRNRALRKLWRSDPILANLDGLVDYGDDYADPSLVRPGIATLYKVGRGLLREPEAASVQEPDHEPVIAQPQDVEGSGVEKADAKAPRERRDRPETA